MRQETKHYSGAPSVHVTHTILPRGGILLSGTHSVKSVVAVIDTMFLTMIRISEAASLADFTKQQANMISVSKQLLLTSLGSCV